MEIILNSEMLAKSEELYKRYCSKGLSFTDYTLLALIEIFGMDYLATFANEFKGLATIISQ